MCFDKKINKYHVQYSWISGVLISSPLQETASIRLQDGSCIGFSGTGDPYLFFDVNGGINKPNIAGKDLFIFYIDKNNKIVPFGGTWKSEALIDKNIPQSCNKKAPYGAGMTCAAKILRDGWQIKNDYPW